MRDWKEDELVLLFIITFPFMFPFYGAIVFFLMVAFGCFPEKGGS